MASIALGEAFIAIGIGATGIGIGLGEVVAAILGLFVATSLWLAYFDFFSLRSRSSTISRAQNAWRSPAT
jgi:low temperature requirement protein LtrA